MGKLSFARLACRALPLVMIVCLCGCDLYWLGGFGPNYVYRSGRYDHRRQLYDVTVYGVVKDSRGRPVYDTIVRAETVREGGRTSTDENGVFSLNLAIGNEEEIDFEFQSGTRVWTHTVTMPPLRSGELVVNFKLGDRRFVKSSISTRG